MDNTTPDDGGLQYYLEQQIRLSERLSAQVQVLERISLLSDGGTRDTETEIGIDSLRPSNSETNDEMVQLQNIEKQEETKSVIKVMKSPCHYNVIGSFFTIKKEKHDFKSRLPWDSSPQNLARDTVEVRNALVRMEERSLEKDIEHKQKRIEVDRMIEELKHDKEEFSKHMKTYREFLNENAEKKQRATEIIEREKKLSKDLEAQISAAREEVRIATEKRDKMKRVINSKQKFVDILEKVCSERPEVYGRCINDVENRYKLLHGILKDAMQEKLENIKQLQTVGTCFTKKNNAYKTEIIAKSNAISNLSERSDIAEKELRKWTRIIDRVNDLTFKNMSEFISVKEDCWNLYTKVCANKHEPKTLSEEQICEQLNVIVNDILDKRRIIKSYKRMQIGKVPKTKLKKKKNR